jgi:hypothetical protein
LPLQGCIESLDLLAEELMGAGSAEAKRSVLRRAEDEWDKAEGQKMQKRAEIYVKVCLRPAVFVLQNYFFL